MAGSEPRTGAWVGRALRLPLRMAPLLVILPFSVLMALGVRVPIPGIVLICILWSWFTKYGFAFLERIAAGDAEPPALSVEMVNPLGERHRFGLLVIVLLVFLGSGAIAYWTGPVLAWLVGMLLVLVLPAVLAVQAATDDLAEALSPSGWTRLLRNVGADYAIVVGVTLVLVLAVAGVVQGFIAGRVPLFVAIALGMYAWLAMHALLGVMLHEHRGELHLRDVAAAIAVNIGSRHRHDVHEDDAFLDEIFAEWRNRAYDNALRSVARRLHSAADPLGELRWLHERTSNWDDLRLAERLAQQLLSRLLPARRHAEALQIARTRLAANPDFRPGQADEVIRLVELARAGGELPMARTLLREFPSRFPESSLGPIAANLTRDLQR